MSYKDFKDLRRRKPADKVLHNKVFNFAINSKYDGCQGGLAWMVYKLFDKNTSVGALMQNQ